MTASRRRPTRRRPRRGCTDAEPRPAWQDEAGLLATPVLLLVWYGLIVAIAVVDVGAYLVAAGRAPGAADAAALAAVSLDVEPASAAPVIAARTVAHRNRGELESCHCRLGSGRAEVEVSVAVHGLFIPRVTGARRVTATAQAELADAGRLAARAHLDGAGLAGTRADSGSATIELAVGFPERSRSRW